MELKVWTPFFDMEKDMRTMFEKVQKAFGESTLFEFRPTTDMVRENGTLVVTTELPGIDPDKDVEITIEGDVLLIKGSKTAEQEVTEKDRYMHERHFGSFERRLLLPDGVDSESIAATYDKGVLTVRATPISGLPTCRLPRPCAAHRTTHARRDQAWTNEPSQLRWFGRTFGT